MSWVPLMTAWALRGAWPKGSPGVEPQHSSPRTSPSLPHSREPASTPALKAVLVLLVTATAAGEAAPAPAPVLAVAAALKVRFRTSTWLPWRRGPSSLSSTSSALVRATGALGCTLLASRASLRVWWLRPTLMHSAWSSSLRCPLSSPLRPHIHQRHEPVLPLPSNVRGRTVVLLNRRRHGHRKELESVIVR